MTGTGTPPGIAHRTITTSGADIHLAQRGVGAPMLLVHGFPETWRAFREVMTLLAEHHQVMAADLPGFGGSGYAGDETDGARVAALLGEVVEQLDVGPVHLVGQDVSGPLTYRLAATRPELVATYTAIETVLPGFGWEALADVAHGGAWYIGMVAAPGVPEFLLSGRERTFLEQFVFAPQTLVPGAPASDDLDEFTSSYSRPGGFRGAAGLYRSLLREGQEIQELATSALTMPVLTVSGSAGDVVPASLRHVAPNLEHVTLPGVGHYVALEAPERLAEVLIAFCASADGRQ